MHKARVEQLLAKFPEKNANLINIKYGQDQCIICFDPFDDHTKVREIPDCAHIFHGSCLQAWWEKQQRGTDMTCPLCNCTVTGEIQRHEETDPIDNRGEETKRSLNTVGERQQLFYGNRNLNLGYNEVPNLTQT